jgi:DNA-binding MarR family transcriptional regulator
MHQIADRLGSERSNVTGIIDRLEARGLVERQPDDRDRRIKNVVLTPAGQEAARNFQRALSAASCDAGVADGSPWWTGRGSAQGVASTIAESGCRW